MHDSIIFDLDGTLWDSTQGVTTAYNIVLKEKYPEVTDTVTAEKLKGLFGLLLDEIGIRLFQSVSREKALQVIKDCCDYENEYLAITGGTLYDGLEDTLKELHQKYKLFIVSNCQAGYIETFFKANPSLEQYFSDYECPGRTGKHKADNIKLVVERNQLNNPIYVGDTQGDANAAKAAGVPFVYARYGFGDVKEYDMVVDSFGELINIF
ncbi:MAG TPA: HAD family hydrolase [Mobilitalea sp.]|nr:HAD family hydrolase [Mobilitalea sp.]